MISNWPGYIDPGKDGTDRRVREKTGVDINYIEDINDNAAVLRQAAAAARPGGLRRPQPLRRHRLDGEADVRPRLPARRSTTTTCRRCSRTSCRSSRTTTRTPSRKFSIPWQGGLTGIWVNTSRGARDRLGQGPLRSQVQGQGHDARRDARHRAAGHAERRGSTRTRHHGGLAGGDRQAPARPPTPGQIRRFTGNEYTEDLTSGNVVARSAGRGTLSDRQRETSSGGSPPTAATFFDQMVIPVGAPNTAAALAFMNFVYEPEVQADIAAYVNYVTPVDGVQGDPRQEAIRSWPTTR